MAHLQTSLTALFEQLGLPSDEAAITQFIAQNGSLPADMPIWYAPCWNASQAQFLREKTFDDGEWVDVIDELNTRMHQTPILSCEIDR